MVVELAMAIEPAIGCQIEDRELDQVITLQDLISVVAPHMPDVHGTQERSGQIVLEAVRSLSIEGLSAMQGQDADQLDLDRPLLDVLYPDRFDG